MTLHWQPKFAMILLGAVSSWVGLPAIAEPVNYRGTRTLSDFEYDVSDQFLTELALRVNCDQAINWLAMPGQGTFLDSIRSISKDAALRKGQSDRDRSWFRMIQSRLMNNSDLLKRCQTLVAASRQGGVTNGLKEIIDLAGGNLTLISVGGFGSHVTPEAPLQTSKNIWQQEFSDKIANKSLRLWHVNCQFSYRSDEAYCADDIKASIERLERDQPSPTPHKYIFWGYSKGGTSILEMLWRDRLLRDRTLGVVTVAAPENGSVVMPIFVPALEKFADEMRLPLEPPPSGVFSFLKLLGLFGIDPGARATAITGDFDGFYQGSKSLTPKNRELYLERKLTPGAYLRSDGSSIKVMQVSGISDPLALKAFPTITIKNGRLSVKEDTFAPTEAIELVSIGGSTAYPISDLCVSLEQSVLPKIRAMTAGLDPTLIATIRLDHAGLRFQPDQANQISKMPIHAMVESILASAVKELKQ